MPDDGFFTFQENVQPAVALTNFWPTEDGFAWSTSSWCEIRVPVESSDYEDAGVVEIAIDLDVFKAPPELPGQNIFVYVDGLRMASRFVSGRVTLLIEAPASSSKDEKIITIDTPDAARPDDFDLGDKRRLGVQLFSIQAREI